MTTNYDQEDVLGSLGLCENRRYPQFRPLTGDSDDEASTFGITGWENYMGNWCIFHGKTGFLYDTFIITTIYTYYTYNLIDQICHIRYILLHNEKQ